MKDDTYYFHQTPSDLAKDLIDKLPIDDDDILYEPFKGEGSFFNNFPSKNTKYYTEIEEGLDYNNFDKEYDWVITNPPFRLQNEKTRINAFWLLIDYFTQKAKKGIAFLANDYCFGTLTPKRIEVLKNRGWYITKLIVCSVKKWRGRYFFIVFTKEKGFYDCLLQNY